MKQMRTNRVLRLAAGAFLAAGTLAACDAPTAAVDQAVAGEPSLLITPACAGTGGQAHPFQYISTAQTWTRANSPHRVTGAINVDAGGRLTIAPGAVVCFEPGTTLTAQNGGRLYFRGRDTAQIVLTARDPSQGWGGITVSGAPATPSYLTNVRIELVGLNSTAVISEGQHPVYLDSAAIRRAGQAVRFYAPGSRLVRSRVDTTTNRNLPAVYLESGTRFEQSVVRGAPSVGVQVFGDDVLLLGGRIEGSGGTGLVTWYHSVNRYSKAIRVVGARGYGAQLSLGAFMRMYATPALQDSLLGNARDTVVIGGGDLRAGQLVVGSRLPVRVTGDIDVDSAGTLSAQPGAALVFSPHARLIAMNGGKILARGSKAAPVLLTADDPEQGWGGVSLWSSPVAVTSYLTNVRIEYVGRNSVGVGAYSNHRVIVDSSVIRQTGLGVALHGANSRLSRTRVDTTLNGDYPAVELASNARIESTRILAPAGTGLAIWSSTVQVASCEVRDGDKDGIVMQYNVVRIQNCNLVNNLGAGIRNYSPHSADVSGNWWGSTGGPLGPGGDSMSGPLVYSPWRTTPFVLPYLP